MEIDGIGWNVDWVRKHTKGQFLRKALKAQHYNHIPIRERIKALGNVYELITKPHPKKEQE